MLLVCPYVAHMHTEDYNTIIRCQTKNKKVFIYPVAQFLCPPFSLPTCSPPCWRCRRCRRPRRRVLRLAARGGGGIVRPPCSNHNDEPMPPPPAMAEAGSISTGIAWAKAGVPPSSPPKVRIVTSHPDNKIATLMMEEEGGGPSTTMVTADDNGRRGGCCPSRHR